MKLNKNIVMLIVLCVVVLLAVIAVFFVNKNSINNCIKDEKVQVETLKEIYKDMFSNLNTQDVNIVLDETALKNILTDERFSEENVTKLQEVEKNVEGAQSTYTLYTKYSKDTEVIAIEVNGSGVKNSKRIQQYKLNVKNSKLNFERYKAGTTIVE
ncbi:MAG: hypothetical protein ACI4ON_06440 [Clostridia bacterium]